MTDRPSATLLDRAIASIFPQWGLNRIRSRLQFDFYTSYSGASRSRDALSGWNTRSGDANSDLLLDLPVLRERSRALIRDNPIARGSNFTKVDYVVGTGLRLSSTPDRKFLGLTDQQADELEDQIESEWAFWSRSINCDLEKSLTFSEHQELAFRQVLENGDHGVLLAGVNRTPWPYRLVIQHIEADRICNPNRVADTTTLVAGVEVDSNGAPSLYHVSSVHPDSARSAGITWTEYPAFSPLSGNRVFLHLFQKLRAGQSRGIPDLSAVIEPLKQMGRFTEAELDSAVKQSIWALLVKTETGEGLAGLNYPDWKETRKEYYNQLPINVKAGSSGVMGLFPDDEVVAFDPSRPNTAFDGFMESLFTQVGMGLDIPKEVITKQFKSSYSAARAALLQAWVYFTNRRVWLANHFCQPIFEAFLYEAVSSGRIRAPGFLVDPRIRFAYCRAIWIGDAQGHIDENKAVTAAADRVANGFSNKKLETSALTGQDWEEVKRQREREMALEGPQTPRSAVAIPAAEDLDDQDQLQPPGAPDEP